ncbi:hypothetical protein GCM10010392_65090 [Streptomyces clavifer]|nr:hypothetical protein GCM10010392_65090 [Streptomyces clavifer]
MHWLSSHRQGAVVTGTEIELPVVDGVLSGVDFGGHGEGVLLVHGSGHNAAAWTDVASQLVSECHPIALDLRGHGQTRLDSTNPEQYWRDVDSVVTALAWDRPVAGRPFHRRVRGDGRHCLWTCGTGRPLHRGRHSAR